MSYILADWPQLTVAYPERIQVKANKQCIQIYGEYNELKAGFGIWDGVTLHRLENRMEYPKIPGLLHAIILFFNKPKNATWKKWIHFCWLELKEEAMLKKGIWHGIETSSLWVMRTFDDKFMLWTNQEDIDDNVDKASLKEYRWSKEENAFIPYTKKPINIMELLLGSI